MDGQKLTVVMNGISKSLTNTTYSDFVKSGSTAAHGLVPKPSTTAGTTHYLREDGTWTVPPDTNTKVTSVVNHYAPSADSSAELTASLSGTAGAYAKDTEYTLLTGVKAQRDAKGHVTGITYTAQKLKDTNTTYSSQAAASGGTGVSLCTTGEKYTWNNKLSASSFTNNNKGTSVGKIMVADASDGLGYSTPMDMYFIYVHSQMEMVQLLY